MDLAAGVASTVFDGDEDRIFNSRFEPQIDSDLAHARAALERFTYGSRPQDVEDFLAMGPDRPARLQAWLDQQLNWSDLDDGACTQRIAAANYSTLSKSVTQLWADHVRGAQNAWPQRYWPVAEIDSARMIRATYSRRQLYEMMVEFWHDHFNVAGWEFSIAPVFVQHDRDGIRPEALGNFRNLLESVATTTAMLYYLDNRANRSGGYNENWARELMELHTLGADVYYPGAFHGLVPIGDDGLAVGYSDADVYDVARCFTGWTVRNGHWQFPQNPSYDTGEFFYFSNWHEGGSKYVLGQWIQPLGQQEARIVMDRLCQHRATALHICRKLCRRFIADEPPQALVESAAAVWRAEWQAPDQIAKVMRHIVTNAIADDLLATKVRRPFELMAATLRKTEAEIEPRHFGDWAPYGELFSRFQQTGHGSFRWPAPDGYPDTALRWTSVSVMGQTWRLLSRLPELRQAGGGPALLQVQALTTAALPNTAQRTATAIVDWWLDRLIPRPVSPARRQNLIDFMRQNAAPDAVLDIHSNLPDGNWSGGNLANHHTPVRLRALVSLITMLPEYHLR